METNGNWFWMQINTPSFRGLLSPASGYMPCWGLPAMTLCSSELKRVTPSTQDMSCRTLREKATFGKWFHFPQPSVPKTRWRWCDWSAQQLNIWYSKIQVSSEFSEWWNNIWKSCQTIIHPRWFQWQVMTPFAKSTKKEWNSDEMTGFHVKWQCHCSVGSLSRQACCNKRLDSTKRSVQMKDDSDTCDVHWIRGT